MVSALQLTRPRALLSLEDARALFAPIATERQEVAAFAYVDAQRQLLGMRHVRSGLSGRVDVPCREVAADALAFDASGVVMAHNHPGGDPQPSPADLAATRKLASLLDAIDVKVLDHLVLAGTTSVSMRAMGLL